MSFFVYPYKTGSASAKAIASALGATLLRRDHSKFVGASTKTVINWGAQTVSGQVENCKIVNYPSRLRSASNKRIFFENLRAYNNSVPTEQRVPHPPTFFSYQEAYGYWVESLNNLGGPATIVARTILNGHSGAGIVILKTQQDWDAFQGTPCNLFTLYVKKMSEYRVHFTDFSSVNPEAHAHPFFTQRKGLTTEAMNSGGPVNHAVRNLANGYVYVNEGGAITIPTVVSLAVANYLKFNTQIQGLHFGALDIIYVKKYNKAYVLEVNAAPGLSGLTIEKYAEQFNYLNTIL